MDSDTYDHDECSYLNRAKSGGIRIIDVPADFEFPVEVMWREPVELSTALPNDFTKGDMAYDLLSDPVEGPWFYVGLGEGQACRVQQAPFVNIKVCPHCGGHL